VCWRPKGGGLDVGLAFAQVGTYVELAAHRRSAGAIGGAHRTHRHRRLAIGVGQATHRSGAQAAVTYGSLRAQCGSAVGIDRAQRAQRGAGTECGFHIGKVTDGGIAQAEGHGALAHDRRGVVEGARALPHGHRAKSKGHAACTHCHRAARGSLCTGTNGNGVVSRCACTIATDDLGATPAGSTQRISIFVHAIGIGRQRTCYGQQQKQRSRNSSYASASGPDAATTNARQFRSHYYLTQCPVPNLAENLVHSSTLRTPVMRRSPGNPLGSRRGLDMA